MNKIIGFIVAICILIGIVYAATDNQNLEKPLKKVQPVVKLKTLDNKITDSTDGLIQIFVDNPSQNALNVDVSAVGNVYFFGTMFPLAGKKNNAGGNFIVPPGQQRTENIMIRSNILGTYIVQIYIEYYTEANRDVYPRKYSFKETFNVKTKSHNITEDRLLKNKTNKVK